MGSESEPRASPVAGTAELRRHHNRDGIGMTPARDSSKDPDSETSDRRSEWLLDGLAIRPPLEEFQRI